jgi:citrate lyase beta subunit
VRTFQFLSMQPPETAARLIRASRRGSATIVLDLEDGLWDVTDEARTGRLKAGGRRDFVSLAAAHPELFEQHPIGVRINRLSGPEAERDLEALAEAARSVELECVVLTKVETALELVECSAALRARRIGCRGVVPIVETRRGLSNFDEIARGAGRAGVEWLVYGHFDFALDSGWWPIPEPDEPRFWEHVEPLIERIEAAGLGYVQPPFLATHDGSGFERLVARLAHTCTREFGVITVGLRQSALAERLGDAEGRLADRVPDSPPRGATDPLVLARHVTAAYLAGRRPDAGFALDPRSGEFIPPHVYLAAQRFLHEVGEGGGDG